MEQGNIYIYAGDGRGKTPAAWGRALQAATEGKKVIVIQFLKGRGMSDSEILRRLEPEIRLFHFEKSDECRTELDSYTQKVIEEVTPQKQTAKQNRINNNKILKEILKEG